MYRYINRHIGSLLNLLRCDNHVQDYDDLMRAFKGPDAANSEGFRRRYVRFWRFRGVDREWRDRYFKLLDQISNERVADPAQLLRRICNETRHNRGGRDSIMFSFATKMAHMVAPDRVPVYDARVCAFYLLPGLPENKGAEERVTEYLRRYKAIVKEYKRVKEKHLLDESIQRFRDELKPKEFKDVKVIDSLIWAFVTRAQGGRGKDPAFLNEELEYD